MLGRVLLTNDDGIEAPGLAVLEEIAREIAREVWVVAPEHDQSGVSHAVSLHHPLRVSERGPRHYAVSGTPGDCAVMGVCHLMGDTLLANAAARMRELIPARAQLCRIGGDEFAVIFRNSSHDQIDVVIKAITGWLATIQ